MAGTALTSGFDVVLQVNSNNFAAAIEANPALRSLANLGVIPLGPLDPSNPPATLTFRPPLQVRFYRSTTTGVTFDLDLALDNAQYNPSGGGAVVSLGNGRSYIRVTATLDRQTRLISPPPAPATPPPPTQTVHLLINTNWRTLQFLPADPTVSPDLITSIRTALIPILSATGTIDLTGMGIPMTPDAAPDPLPAGQIRDLAPVILNGSGSTVDAVAIGLRLLQASRGVPAGLTAVGSNVGALEGGALILNNGFVFAQIRTGLIGAGIASGDMSVDAPPTTLTIRSGAPAFGATILTFTLSASGNTLQLNAVLQLPIPTHTVIYTGTGPVTFAFARGGNLVVGTNLTSSVDVRINGLGAFIIGALAVIGAAVSVVTFGSGSAAVGAIAFGVGVAAGFVIGRMIDELAQAIFRALGPTIQVQLETAFQGAGGVIPQNLLTGLGATMNFEPPIVFDDLKIGVSLRQLSSVGELRREDGVVVLAARGFDLDVGVIRAIGEAGVDLEWRDATIRAGGGARIVALAGRFLELTHSDLERLVVGPSATVSAFSIPIIVGTRVPEPLLLGIRTEQLRYAKVAVWQDTSGRLILRYVLYNDLAPNARIIGGIPTWRRVATVQDSDTPPMTIFDSAHHNFRDANEGSFRLLYHRLELPVTYVWRLDRYDLALPAGAVRIGSEMVSYTVHNDVCVLRTSLGGSFRASLSCFATDASGVTVSDMRSLAVDGHRSVPFGRSEAQMIEDSLGQFEINRAFFIPGDYLPDPPPDILYRVSDAGIEQVAPVAVFSPELSVDPSVLLHAAELAIGHAIAPLNGKPVEIRLA